MYYRSRLVILLVILAILLVPATSAQEETFGLSDEDFALFSSQEGDFDAIAFDFTVDLTVSGVPDSNLNIQLDGTGIVGADSIGLPVAHINFSGPVDVGDGPTDFNFETRVVDGIVYWNMGDGSGWLGISLDAAMTSAEGLLPVSPDDLASGDSEAMDAMMPAMMSLMTLDPADYVSISRLADEVVMDMNTAHFSTSVDLGGFLASDAFGEILDAAGQMSGDDSISGVGPMIGMMFQNSNLTLDQYISTSDNTVRRGTFGFGLLVDPAVMGSSGDAMDVGLTIDVIITEINPAVNVEAPADATLLDDAL